MFDITLSHYLILALIIFILGVIIIISDKNLVKTLIGTGFLFNGAILIFAVANSFITEENSLLNTVSKKAEGLASIFAPLEQVIENFSMPVGQSAALVVTVFGAIQTVACFGLIYCIYLKYKNTGAQMLCALKSDESKKESEF